MQVEYTVLARNKLRTSKGSGKHSTATIEMKLELQITLTDLFVIC